MPPFKYVGDSNSPAKIEYNLPSSIENDAQLSDYFEYLKSIATGIGSIKSIDMEPFYYLMDLPGGPNKFDKGLVLKLFGFLSKSRDAERFEDANDAMKCIAKIEDYRTEMGF